jgi:hypothetical protein
LISLIFLINLISPKETKYSNELILAAKEIVFNHKNTKASLNQNVETHDENILNDRRNHGIIKRNSTLKKNMTKLEVD